MLFGCNLLHCASKSGPTQRPSAHQQQTNRVTVLATPITGNHSTSSTMSWDQQHPPPPYIKVPEVVDMVENALSPALSGVSDPSESFAGSTRTGSFSVSRIEDSLEELDRLEEQLEAVGALAKVKTTAPGNDAGRSPAAKSAGGSPSIQSLTQRISVMSLNSKTSEKSLRRSASMTLRQKNRQPATPSTKKADSPASGSTRRSVASTPSRSPTAKSTKPPTVPKFELPGEAVGRRLREQREARQAASEKSQKVIAAPAKPRTVTKASFELPGEAISRRKRELHEAKVRAEEEELRRKREFKARPFRNSAAPGVVPRETIASRARQAKLLQEEEAKAKAAAAAAAATMRSKRLSVVPSGLVSATSGTVRKTSAPTAGQRPTSSLSAAQKTARRQSTVSDISAPRPRTQPAQDAGVKSARDQAAERSRAASREWAEKKRRQELAQKEAQRRGAAGSQVVA